jgi:DNA-binding GntR family transcriptional regulator
MGAVLQASGSRDAIWDEHQAIADAVEAGDADRAARLVELHTDKARRNLLDRLGKVLAEREA